jgi:flagellar basal body rod protein FlgC
MSGLGEYTQVREIAKHADCSTDGARDALRQLVEMGVVETRGSRPVEYRRNAAYFRWKRIETLASEHTPDELKTKIDTLVTEDASFQDQFDATDPDAITPALLEDRSHEAVHETLETVARWRTIRDDLTVLRRAAYRAAQNRDDVDTGVSA